MLRPVSQFVGPDLEFGVFEDRGRAQCFYVCLRYRTTVSINTHCFQCLKIGLLSFHGSFETAPRGILRSSRQPRGSSCAVSHVPHSTGSSEGFPELSSWQPEQSVRVGDLSQQAAVDRAERDTRLKKPILG